MRTYDEICADIARVKAATDKTMRRAKLGIIVGLIVAVVGLSIVVTYVRHVGLKSIVGQVWEGEGK